MIQYTELPAPVLHIERNIYRIFLDDILRRHIFEYQPAAAVFLKVFYPYRVKAFFKRCDVRLLYVVAMQPVQIYTIVPLFTPQTLYWIHQCRLYGLETDR